MANALLYKFKLVLKGVLGIKNTSIVAPIMDFILIECQREGVIRKELDVDIWLNWVDNLCLEYCISH